MGITVKVKKKKGDKELCIQAKIKNVKVFIDWILELAIINMLRGDTLSITWNVDVDYYVNSTHKDRKKITAHATFVPTKGIKVRFVRFTHKKKKSVIRVYEKLPTGY